MKLKMLLYCTKAGLILRDYRGKANVLSPTDRPVLNGKIVAECDFEVEEITKVRNYYDMKPEAFDNLYYTRTLDCEQLSISSCMTTEQFDNYLKDKNGYAIHIEDLHVFDKPKKISDFYKSTNEITFEPPLPLIKAPQNMCYAYDKYGNKYVVISVYPYWACKILNGEKTIEVRKKVLKEML